MDYPEHDEEFTEEQITAVEKFASGQYAITGGIGSLGCGEECPIEPKVGQTARYYTRGMGHAVRGLFIDGVKIWYRTETEQKEYTEIQSYGRDAADWLDRWDNDKSVWSIEMGGLGPGYEQAIQITAAEILRHLLEVGYDSSLWKDEAVWKVNRGTIEAYSHANERIKKLGLSGAQWAGALSLATKLYMDGPRKIMNDPAIEDRHIQVSLSFP